MPKQAKEKYGTCNICSRHRQLFRVLRGEPSIQSTFSLVHDCKVASMIKLCQECLDENNDHDTATLRKMQVIAEIIQACEQQGVTILRDANDDLVFQGTPEALSPELLALMSQHKDALIDAVARHGQGN